MRWGSRTVLPHALVVPVGPEDDGVVGEHDEDQEHGVEPARPPLTAARAREMTAGLREAMDDVLALLCDEIGETVENGLAARRYALTGDRRALAGTLL